jgi:hypothetical protein
MVQSFYKNQLIVFAKKAKICCNFAKKPALRFFTVLRLCEKVFTGQLF